MTFLQIEYFFTYILPIIRTVNAFLHVSYCVYTVTLYDVYMHFNICAIVFFESTVLSGCACKSHRKDLLL